MVKHSLIEIFIKYLYQCVYGMIYRVVVVWKGGGAQWMKIFVPVRIWDDLCGGGMEKGEGHNG